MEELADSIGFIPGTQNDAEEFYSRLMVKIDKEVRDDLTLMTGPIEHFETELGKKLICVDCGQLTYNETLNSLSLRLRNLIQNLTKLAIPGELTDELSNCKHCHNLTQRKITLTSIHPKSYFMIILDKAFLKKLDKKIQIPVSINIDELNKALGSKDRIDRKEQLKLHASIHHHGEDYSSGHYTMKIYNHNHEEEKIQIVDDTIRTEDIESTKDGLITTIDTYMILYILYPLIEQSQEKNKSKKSILAPGPAPKTKKEKKPNLPPKDDKQRSINEFFTLHKKKDAKEDPREKIQKEI